jgi:hypothetical protein
MRFGQIGSCWTTDTSFPERHSGHRAQESKAAAVAINGGEVPALTPYCKTSDAAKAPQQGARGETSLAMRGIGE